MRRGDGRSISGEEIIRQIERVSFRVDPAGGIELGVGRLGRRRGVNGGGYCI